MRRILTFYVLLIGLLLSQDAFRLMIKNVVSVKNTTSVQNTIFENSEESQDQTEDQTEITEDALTASLYHFETPEFISLNELKNWNFQLSKFSILLDKFTPPPQA